MLFFFFSGRQPFFGGYAIEPLPGFQPQHLTPRIKQIQLPDPKASEGSTIDAQSQWMSWRVVNYEGHCIARGDNPTSDSQHTRWPHDVDQRIRHEHLIAPDNGALLYLLCGCIQLEINEAAQAILEPENNDVDYLLEFDDADGHPILDRDENGKGLYRFIENEFGILIPADQVL